MRRFRIDLSNPTFRRDLTAAKKSHSSIVEDLSSAFEVLEDHPDLGDWIPGVGAEVRKVRIGVKKAHISKQRGYRLIYFVDAENAVIKPLLLHYKPTIELIPPAEISKIVKEMLDKQSSEAALNGPSPSDLAN